LTIKRGKIAVSGTPVVVSQGQIQQQQLQIQPQRTNSLLRAQSRGKLYQGASSAINKQGPQYQRGGRAEHPSKTNPMNTNINTTQLNQHSIFS